MRSCQLWEGQAELLSPTEVGLRWTAANSQLLRRCQWSSQTASLRQGLGTRRAHARGHLGAAVVPAGFLRAPWSCSLDFRTEGLQRRGGSTLLSLAGSEAANSVVVMSQRPPAFKTQGARLPIRPTLGNDPTELGVPGGVHHRRGASVPKGRGSRSRRGPGQWVLGKWSCSRQPVSRTEDAEPAVVDILTISVPPGDGNSPESRGQGHTDRREAASWGARPVLSHQP